VSWVGSGLGGARHSNEDFLTKTRAEGESGFFGGANPDDEIGWSSLKVAGPGDRRAVHAKMLAWTIRRRRASLRAGFHDFNSDAGGGRYTTWWMPANRDDSAAVDRDVDAAELTGGFAREVSQLCGYDTDATGRTGRRAAFQRTRSFFKKKKKPQIYRRRGPPC